MSDWLGRHAEWGKRDSWIRCRWLRAVDTNAIFTRPEPVEATQPVMVGQQLISYREYQKRVVLQTKGMSLDSDGEIVAGGVRLKDTMPPQVYELMLKGLEAGGISPKLG